MTTSVSAYSYSTEEVDLAREGVPSPEQLAIDDILVVAISIYIDAETILKDFAGNTGTAGNPKRLRRNLDKYIMIFVKEKNKAFRQVKASAQLVVTAKQWDLIQWREMTFSGNADYGAVLYQYNHLGGDKIFEDDQGNSTLRALMFTKTVPLPNTKKPTEPTTQQIKDYFWQAQVAKDGTLTEQYDFSFMIIKKDQKLGYFRWDPTIKVTP